MTRMIQGTEGTDRRRIYFASDMHLGSRYHQDPGAVERRLVSWLRSIREDARAVMLVGDVFDYWFEYKYVVPKGFVRFLGALAELVDTGVEVHIFTGNHDVWIFDYLESEVGAKIHQKPQVFEYDGKRFFVAHGDEFDHRKRSFRLVRKIFHSRLCQRLYAAIHPRWSVGFAHAWSLASRKKGLKQGSERYCEREYLGEQHEYLVQYARKYLNEYSEEAINFFIFGHRHIMLDLMLTRDSRIVILGDWISFFSYAVWDGETLVLDQLLPPDE